MLRLFVILVLAFSADVLGKYSDYSVAIDELGTKFVEKIKINDQNSIAIYDVPAHRDLDAATVMIDQDDGVTVTKVHKLKTCFLERERKDEETPAQLRDALIKTKQIFPKTKHTIIEENVVIHAVVEDKDSLGPEIVKFCAGYKIKIVKVESTNTRKDYKDLKGMDKNHMSKRFVFPPGRSVPDACDETYTGNEMEKCYGGSPPSFTFNLRCKVVTKNCNYRMTCKNVAQNNLRTWDCDGVHLYRNLMCCDMVCVR